VEQLKKMSLETAAAARSKPLILLGLLLLFAVAVAGCGEPTPGLGRSEENFDLPTPIFPNRSIEIIVGAEAGSPEDTFAAAIGAAYASALPGEFNVVYEPGNHGLTALEQFSQKPNDGHTMLIFTDRHISALAAGQTQVDVTRAHLPNLLGVFEPLLIYAPGGGSSLTDWDAVVAAAGSGTLKVASGGPDAGAEDLSISRLAADLNIDLERVVIDAVSERLAAPGAGTTDLVIARLSTANEAAVAGNLAPVLVLWPERVPDLPSVPTALESGSTFEGLPGMLGVAINRRTPQFITDEIGFALRAAFASPAYQAWASGRGIGSLEVPTGDPGFNVRNQIQKFTDAAGG
jgi:tripartite-type tricarboxylate transporter receptor subunit TctC